MSCKVLEIKTEMIVLADTGGDEHKIGSDGKGVEGSVDVIHESLTKGWLEHSKSTYCAAGGSVWSVSSSTSSPNACFVLLTINYLLDLGRLASKVVKLAD